MKCIILCAGYATRLYPITKDFPKPLLKIGDKTILDWLIDDIDSCKIIDSYIVVSNHKYYNHFCKWAETKHQNIIVLDDGTTSNENRLGAVRDMQFAIKKVNIDDDVLVIAGDNVLDFSLVKFIEYSQKKQTSCIMRYFEPDEKQLTKSAVVSVDEKDKILKMVEKPNEPETNWCCPPFYFYIKKDLELITKGINEGCKTDAPGYFAAWISTQVTVHSMEMPGKRYDIGTIESYKNVKETYKGVV